MMRYLLMSGQGQDIIFYFYAGHARSRTPPGFFFQDCPPHPRRRLCSRLGGTLASLRFVQPRGVCGRQTHLRSASSSQPTCPVSVLGSTLHSAGKSGRPCTRATCGLNVRSEIPRILARPGGIILAGRSMRDIGRQASIAFRRDDGFIWQRRFTCPRRCDLLLADYALDCCARADVGRGPAI